MTLTPTPTSRATRTIAATNNVYVVTVRATEDAPDDQEEPAKYTEIQVRVTVTNANEDGEIDIVVRQPQVGVALTATASDPDTRNADGSTNTDGTSGTPALAWQWSLPKLSRPITDNDNHWADATGSGDDSATYTPVAADVGSVLRAQATYTDGTGEERTLNILTEFPVRAVPVDENDAATNDAPVFPTTGDYTRTIAENSSTGTLLGAPVTATDVNGDVLYYTLTGADAASFAIDKITGQVTVNGPIDFEAGSGGDQEYAFTVTAIDPFGDGGSPDGGTTQDVTVTITDVNEKPTVAADGTPTLSTPEIDSTPAPADPAYTSALSAAYTRSDPDAADTGTGNLPGMTLAGDDAALFTLTDENDDGTYDLAFMDDPNYDKPGDADKDNTYKVSVVATDKAGLTGVLDVEVVVTDVSEDGTVTVSPGQPAIGRPVTAELSEPDTQVSDLEWQWQSSPTGGATGTWTDIEGATSDTYTPRDTIPDDETTPDVNESRPTDEGMFLRAIATYIDAAAPLNTDTADDLEDQVEQTAMGDSEFAVRKAPDVNNAPVFESTSIMREVREDTEMGGDVGDAVEATDADGDDLTYSITGGADMDKFTNDGAQIQVGSAEFDYDDPSAQQTFEVELTASDPFGGVGSTMVTITVTDFNEAPEFEAPEEIDDYEENGIGAVAVFTGPDPEGADVIWSTSGTDGSLFTAEDGVLTFKESPNYEDPQDSDHPAGEGDDTADGPTNNTYVLDVRATEDVPDDQEEPAKYTEHQIRVTVTNKDEDGEIDILVRQPQVGVALTATASDPDTRNADGSANANGTSGTPALAWQWSVPKLSRPLIGEDNHWIDAAGSGDDSATYTPAAGDIGKVLRAQATYTDGTGEERTLNILTEFTVRAAVDAADNNAPNAFDAADNERTVDENSAMGTLVGAPVTTTDSNAGDVLYYTIPAAGDANPFAIDKKTGQITVAGTVHFEATDGNGPAYTVTVTATDPSGTTTTIDITITAKDVNEKPTVTEADGAVKTTVEINSTPPDGYTYTSGLASLTYTSADADAADTGAGNEPKFSLAGDDMESFNLTVSTTNANEAVLSFKSDPDYDKPGDADKDNTYKVSVVATDKAGLTGMADVEIVVEDVSEDGTVTVSPGQPAIGRPVTAMLSEPDTQVSDLKWQWQSSPTGVEEPDSFTDIEGATSDTYTPKAMVPDDPATPDIDETSASDEGLFLRAVATYIDAAAPLDTTTADDLEDQVAQTAMAKSDNAVRAVPAVNSDPDFGGPQMREVREDADAGDDVGDPVEANDADMDDLTYEITGGADMDKFTNDGPQIQVGSDTMLNFEGDQRTYMIELTARDPFGGVGSTMVTITVTNFNEPPDLSLRPTAAMAPEFDSETATFTVGENEVAGTRVGTVDAGTAEYMDNSGYFDVDNSGNITTTMMLDHEAMSSHMVTVTATNDEGSDSIDVTVMVGNSQPGCDDAGNMGLVNDCEALLDAQADLGGSLDWSTHTDNPISGWEGVTVSGDPMRVTGVNLRGKGLDGTMSSALGRLDMVTVLNLHTNDLSGPIPDLSGVPLTQLYLSQNELTGTIPASVAGNADMTDLWLWGNQLTGPVPDLSGMTSLNILKLQNNMLGTGSSGVPDGSMLPPNASWILLQDNGFGGTIPDLSGLSARTLWLHSNGLTGSIDPAMLPASVTSLELRNNNLSGTIPDMTSLSNLVFLRLHGNSLSGTVPGTLGDLANLVKLRLNDNNLTGIDAGLENAADTLTHLFLAGNSFTAGTCLMGDLADVANNDFNAAGLEACP